MYARLFIDLENMPIVLLDSDAEGKKVYENLVDTIFSNNKKNVLKIGDFTNKNYDTEIEDFIGRELLVDCINKNNITDSPISINLIEEGTFIDKLVDNCHKYNIKFKDKVNWKYNISLKFKNSVIGDHSEDIISKIDDEKIETFEKLITTINKNAKKKVD